jgi:hypothetical protein
MTLEGPGPETNGRQECLPHEENEGKNWPRQCARAANIAPLAAVLLTCLAGGLARNQPENVLHQLNLLSSTVALVLVVGGLAAGVYGVIGGRRRGSRDTVIIAALGLLVGGCLATFWIVAFVWWWWR